MTEVELPAAKIYWYDTQLPISLLQLTLYRTQNVSLPGASPPVDDLVGVLVQPLKLTDLDEGFGNHLRGEVICPLGKFRYAV